MRDAPDSSCSPSPDARRRLPTLQKSTSSAGLLAAPMRFAESLEENPCPACGQLHRESKREDRGSEPACAKGNLRAGPVSQPPAWRLCAKRKAANLRTILRPPAPQGRESC